MAELARRAAEGAVTTARRLSRGRGRQRDGGRARVCRITRLFRSASAAQRRRSRAAATGSALKPFVYAAAMARLGMTPATLLPDVELALPTPEGTYRPRLRRPFGPPVRLRDALANSLNVPAVYTACASAPSACSSCCAARAFVSRTARTHYGVALALGDGEVKLSELAGAYVMLARGGQVPLPLAKRARITSGRVIAASTLQRPSSTRARSPFCRTSSPTPAALGRGVRARPARVSVPGGGEDRHFQGLSRQLDGGLHARGHGRGLGGQFRRHADDRLDGVTGAGPLFHEVMLAAMRGRVPVPLVDWEGLVDVEVCALSGARPGPHCTHRTHELFRPDEVPSSECTMHVTALVDLVQRPSRDAQLLGRRSADLRGVSSTVCGVGCFRAPSNLAVDVLASLPRRSAFGTSDYSSGRCDVS